MLPFALPCIGTCTCNTLACMLTCSAEGVWHGEREGSQENDLQQVQEEVVYVEPCSELKPLLIQHCDHQRMV